MPARHTLDLTDLDPRSLDKVLIRTYEEQPAGFESLLGVRGVGPKALRSLALLAELIYEAPASRRDPALYSFAHGGKDGHPFPVTRNIYDENIERLREAINAAKIGHSEKLDALRRLAAWLQHR